MKLSKEESCDIVSNYHPDYDIISDEITGKGRWTDSHSIVVKNTRTGLFYEAGYRCGSTENCDERPWEFEPVVQWHEVEPVQITTTIYKRKKHEA